MSVGVSARIRLLSPVSRHRQTWVRNFMHLHQRRQRVWSPHLTTRYLTRPNVRVHRRQNRSPVYSVHRRDEWRTGRSARSPRAAAIQVRQPRSGKRKSPAAPCLPVAKSKSKGKEKERKVPRQLTAAAADP